MSVPNYADVVREVFYSGRFDVKTHDGAGVFTEAVVLALHKQDDNFGHLRKHGAQNQYNGHAVDAALYRATGQTVDFISSAGGPDAKVGWIVNEGDHYPESEWYAPEPQAAPVVPPPTEPPPAPLIDLVSVNEKLEALKAQVADVRQKQEDSQAAIIDAITHLRQEALDAVKNLQTQLPILLSILRR